MLCIEAALQRKEEKLQTLKKAQIEIEVLKRFVRLAFELDVYNEQAYLTAESVLQQISKMTAGWLKYVTQKEP